MTFSSVTGFGAYFQWNFKVVYLISNCCIGTVWYTVFQCTQTSVGGSNLHY